MNLKRHRTVKFGLESSGSGKDLLQALVNMVMTLGSQQARNFLILLSNHQLYKDDFASYS